MGVGKCERCGAMGMIVVTKYKGLEMKLCNTCKQAIIKAVMLPVEIEVQAYEKAKKDMDKQDKQEAKK